MIDIYLPLYERGKIHMTINFDFFGDEKELKRVKRGQICYYTFPDAGKHVQAGRRPCLVVGNNKQNTFSDVAVIVPITSSKTKKAIPTHVDIPEGYGIYGTILCEQIMTASLSKLSPTNEHLDKITMEKVDTALSIELGISSGMKKKNNELLKLTSENEILKYKLLQYRGLLEHILTLNAFEKVGGTRSQEQLFEQLEDFIFTLRK